MRKHILLSTATGPTGDTRGKLTLGRYFLTYFIANSLKKTWHGNILNFKQMLSLLRSQLCSHSNAFTVIAGIPVPERECFQSATPITPLAYTARPRLLK